LGWLVAIAYLLGSMNPSLAATISVNFADLSVPAAHETHVWTGEHQHSHTGVIVSHSHDLAMADDDNADQDPHSDRHANCCGSALCFSAVSPKTLAFLQFGAPRSRCESMPDLMADEGAFGRLYRPPIT
jgi:hypothetical protein